MGGENKKNSNKSNTNNNNINDNNQKIENKLNKNNEVKNIKIQQQPQNDFWIDFYFVILLSIAGIYSRCIKLDHPNSVVFDEQHFGLFTNWYIAGKYFLDIHPPLGKLIFLITSYFIGYNGEYRFSAQGEVYTNEHYIVLRMVPAVFGGLLIPLIYLTARNLKLTPSISVLVSWMIICENLIITESRYILMDSFLFFFDILAIYCSLKANQQRIFSIRWIIWLFLTSISMGLAVSVKFTALGIVGAIGFHQCIILLNRIKRNIHEQFFDFAIRLSLLLLPMFFLFIIFFIIHMELLPFSGDGDLFMSKQFRARLVHEDGTLNGYPGTAKSLFPSIIELISTMHRVNVELTATHPFSSLWNEWIVNQGRILLYWQILSDGFGMWIYGTINPVSGFIGTFIGVLGFGFLMFFYIISAPFQSKFIRALRRAMDKHFIEGYFIFLAYLANILPYYFITRATWTYHYIPPLIISYLMAGIVFQIILETLEEIDFDYHLNFKVILSFLFVLIGGAFTYLAPWTFAFPMSDYSNDRKFVFDSWRWRP